VASLVQQDLVPFYELREEVKVVTGRSISLIRGEVVYNQTCSSQAYLRGFSLMKISPFAPASLLGSGMAAVLLLAATAAFSQSPAVPATPPTAQPTGPAAEVNATYNRLKGNILKAADKMPAEDYQFKGTPEIRTYERVVNHIIEAQQHTCNALLGQKFDPASVPSDTADKAAVVAGLKASFELCDKAYGSLTDANIAETIAVGQGKRSRIGAAWGNVSHDNEQYAILSMYLRIKGLVPPTSEK
jgi:hypothetical protein